MKFFHSIKNVMGALNKNKYDCVSSNCCVNKTQSALSVGNSANYHEGGTQHGTRSKTSTVGYTILILLVTKTGRSDTAYWATSGIPFSHIIFGAVLSNSEREYPLFPRRNFPTLSAKRNRKKYWECEPRKYFYL